uniref:Uncharacterized protein n=1 Tax=Nelumbo nucifera TaxID=4432 RepID=A0A822XWE6_NELNU|nr:TPA_asm: hypothetical protein HUJ06_026111 [Nelumbo nucifera]
MLRFNNFSYRAVLRERERMDHSSSGGWILIFLVLRNFVYIVSSFLAILLMGPVGCTSFVKSIEMKLFNILSFNFQLPTDLPPGLGA